MYGTRSAATGVMELLLFSRAYWSLAPSIMRQVSSVEVAWERLRARRKLGTAMAAGRAMIATTIMISTSVKPERREWSLDNICGIYGLWFSAVRAAGMIISDSLR